MTCCEVVPVIAMSRFPLWEGRLFASPPYCALNAYVPGTSVLDAVGICTCAVPLDTVPRKKQQPGRVKVTVPVTAFEELTLAVSVNVDP